MGEQRDVDQDSPGTGQKDGDRPPPTDGTAADAGGAEDKSAEQFLKETTDRSGAEE